MHFFKHDSEDPTKGHYRGYEYDLKKQQSFSKKLEENGTYEPLPQERMTKENESGNKARSSANELDIDEENLHCYRF